MKLHELIDYLNQFDRDCTVFLDSSAIPPGFGQPFIVLSNVLPSPSSDNLTQWRVSYKEDPGDKFTFMFACWAEDADHAADQCRDAYPGCEVVNCTEIEE